MNASFPFTVDKFGQPSLWSDDLYREIAPSWRFDICKKCDEILIVNFSSRYGNVIPAGFYDGDDSAGNFCGYLDLICSPCAWYTREFFLRLDRWEAARDWNRADYYETTRPQYIENLCDALWYSPVLENMRDDYARYVVRLIQLKREEAHKERQEASPVAIPRQVPWSWLENTDWGRFSMDNEPKAS